MKPITIMALRENCQLYNSAVECRKKSITHANSYVKLVNLEESARGDLEAFKH